MDDEDFEDLFSQSVNLLKPSSQGSLIGAAANLAIDHEEEADEPNLLLQNDDWQLNGKHEISYDSLPVNTTSFTETVQQSDFRPAKRLQLRQYPNAAVIDRIETVFEEITDAMLNDKLDIAITLKPRKRAPWTSSQATSETSNPEAPTRRLSFPGKTADEAWRFSVVLRILELIHEALRNDVVISKRDIYYHDPALFGSQNYVDKYVDDIAHTFGISRSLLNVSAAAKGLVAGALAFYRKDGAKSTACSNQEGILVPSLREVLSVDMFAVKWILVIEKEATFRSIAASDFWVKISSEGVILTGKGYPDLATRALLRYLSTPSSQNCFASPPVFGLADYDPDGIAILSTYKRGSKALAHESQDHAVSQLQWLGLRSEHLHAGGHGTHVTQGLLALTKRDRSVARKMLDQPEAAADEDTAMQRRELQIMLMLNTKAELQLLDAIPDGMTDLLSSALG